MKKTISIVCLLFSFGVFASCPSVLDHKVRVLGSTETANLCEFQNKVVLAVNVASQCGYTYQYEALQALYEQHKDDGFVVLGFPSGDFFQEFTEEEKVKEFCQTTYGVDFPMFKRSHVTNGGKLRLRNYKANPFFAELIKKTGVQPAWNFNKYLIARDGSVKHYNEKVEPDSTLLTSEIVALISK